MGKVRVYELAKTLNMGNKELVQKLQEMGYPVKSHSSTLEEYLVQEIKKRVQGKAEPAAADNRARPTVIRRRKKVVAPPPEEEAPLELTAEDAPAEEAAPAVEPEVEPPVGEAPSLEEASEEVGDRAAVVVRPAAPAEEAAAAPEEEVSVAAVADEPVEEAEAAEAPEEEPVVQEAKPAVEAETEAEIEARPEAERVVEAKEEIEDEVATADEPEVTMDAATEIAMEAEAVSDVESVVQPESRPDEPSVQPATETRVKAKLKIKRIEKVTTEPAKIISRPVAPKVKVTPVKPPVQARPEAAPPPRAQAKPEPPVEAVPVEPAASAETRKGRKKKKGADQAAREDADARRLKSVRRREIIERAELYDSAGWDRSPRGRKAGRQAKKSRKTEITIPKAIKRRIKVSDAVTVADLAKRLGIKVNEVIRHLLSMGVMANMNQSLDYDTAVLVANEFGYEVEKGSFDEEHALQVAEVAEADMGPRPPVVTVMGHVDHGKTSLLDAIRQTDVIEGEAGGITQHIGAYNVEVNGHRITFLDTPGHEAFTSMRARGAQVTDIVVLIVAADDGVMQQTREAADHAKAAGVPIIVAVNKIDKPDAEPERIRREVSEIGLVPEDWGGDTIFVDVSAKTGEGLEDLLDMILLQSEMLELKAPNRGRAHGRIIEARLDKGRGPVATILVQRGQLKQGDPYVCGVFSGKVRAMLDDAGNLVTSAGPSMPVEIQGISGVPLAGDEFIVVEDDKMAKQVSQHRQLKQRENDLIKTSKLTLENLFDSIKEGAAKDLNLILKADVQGSLEAITDALMKMETDEIKIHILRSSTGAISEGDIMLASTSNALVVGFNVRPNIKIQDLAEGEGVQIRFYDVIYKLIEEIKDAMVGLLEPIKQERVLGRAEVRTPFHVSKVGMVAGSSVVDGKIIRGSLARLLRDDIVIYDGKISSLKRFKEDAREVLSGYECGIGLENYNDIKIGDVIEAYVIDEVAPTLD